MKIRTTIVLLSVVFIVSACQENPGPTAPDSFDPGSQNLDSWSPSETRSFNKSGGSVTGTTSLVTLQSSFYKHDYGPKQDPRPDHGFLKAWNPGSSTACEEPTDPFLPSIYGQSYCHFKILDAAGDCILFNSSIWGPTDIGYQMIRMELPVGEALTVANIVFPSSSDYSTIMLYGYYQVSDFALEKGETYTFQITEQVAGYNTSRDGELVRFTEQFTVPCCVGMRGNVDDDPQDQVDISDVVAMVDYMFRGGTINCVDEANVDGIGGVDISDLNYLVDYMFNGGPAPVACD